MAGGFTERQILQVAAGLLIAATVSPVSGFPGVSDRGNMDVVSDVAVPAGTKSEYTCPDGQDLVCHPTRACTEHGSAVSDLPRCVDNLLYDTRIYINIDDHSNRTANKSSMLLGDGDAAVGILFHTNETVTLFTSVQVDEVQFVQLYFKDNAPIGEGWRIGTCPVSPNFVGDITVTLSIPEYDGSNLLIGFTVLESAELTEVKAFPRPKAEDNSLTSRLPAEETTSPRPGNPSVDEEQPSLREHSDKGSLNWWIILLVAVPILIAVSCCICYSKKRRASSNTDDSSNGGRVFEMQKEKKKLLAVPPIKGDQGPELSEAVAA